MTARYSAGIESCMNTQPPSLGRMVLYRPIEAMRDTKVRPAIIIDILTSEFAKDQDRVQLQVFTPNGDVYLDAAWSEQGKAGTWFWPPKVAARPVKIEKSDVPEETQADAETTDDSSVTEAETAT